MKYLSKIICLTLIALNIIVVALIPTSFAVHAHNTINTEIAERTAEVKRLTPGQRSESGMNETWLARATQNTHTSFMVTTSVITLLMILNLVISILIYRIADKLSLNKLNKVNFTQLLVASGAMLLVWMIGVGYFLTMAGLSAMGKEATARGLLGVVFVLQPVMVILMLATVLGLLATKVIGQNKVLVDENSLAI